MLKKIFYFAIILIAFFRVTSLAQTSLPMSNKQASANDTIPNDTTLSAPLVMFSSPETDVDTIPVINYTATPKEYIIADIKVTGIENTMYEDQSFVLIGFSGLAKGDRIQVPGEEITQAVERFWKQGLFSDVKILANKIKGDSIWLEIRLTDRPRISDIRYIGMKKGEQEDIEKKLGMVRGNQITPNQINSAKAIIKKYFEEKGFGDAEVTIIERSDESNKNQVILEIMVDKKEKLGVHQIKIEGNKAVSDKKLKGAMKKTNEKKLANLFKTKKFVKENYEADKKNLIAKYHELGYRDAEIVWDTVYKYNEKSVNIEIKVEEGPLYHIRSINWVGNTVYNSYDLSRILNMQQGDVYNQKKLQERLLIDEDAVITLYKNNGYLFSNIDPIEINIENDSVDLDFALPKVQSNHKTYNYQGNDRVYEDVIRRELEQNPGGLQSGRSDTFYSRIGTNRSFRSENLQPDIKPNFDDGTVDITYPLTSKETTKLNFLPVGELQD